ncbi:Fmu (Sun) domain-containing protein [Terrimonas sp. NA20]|uniref:Fmu (Sun) domain-containing protein n=1 Tax=Terrimonas ginsenosidimutans TaxID=2908004 RepID=A0ABS9KU88_9BACT|nr:Fmu (Sun) domain-containing protein [Terrimonas ginsenosidimutans]MCG2615901.1 Fmu (Sun) domain-containing protein [Terrimonas ginsenosidimutans]
MKHYSHLNTAALILTQYKGAQPFGLFIKDFFKADKKYGSKDRKRISSLCYSYFRLGKIGEELQLQERILLGLFLSAGEPDRLLGLEKPEWNANVSLSIGEKLALTGHVFEPGQLFPGITEVSPLVDRHPFVLSHFIQPDLFLRLRPGREERVKAGLADAGISFEVISNDCLALPNASKLDDVVSINHDAVIQDNSSQRVIELLDSVPGFVPKSVWDCCAASGGKSLLIYDRYPGVQLTVSDVRENILANLNKRFREAGITQYKGFVADLSKPVKPNGSFDLLVTDVPCTGSGTWGRTPEQLVFFSEGKIEEYASRQRQIILNTWKHLKPGGYFLYITCSVYKKENEDAVAFATQNTALKLVRSSLFQGYERRADTLFAALFHYEK